MARAPEPARLLLVGLESETVALLRARHANEALLHTAEPDTLASQIQTQERGLVEAVVVGPLVVEPVAVAQRVHAIDRDVAVLILAAADREPHVMRSLQFSPFLGDDVRCVPTRDAEATARAAMEAATRTRQRRAYRAMLAAASERLAATPRPGQPLAAQYLGRLLEHAPVGVALVDGSGLVLGWNRRAGQLLGREAQEVLGKPLAELFPAGHRAALSDLLEESLHGGTAGPAVVATGHSSGAAEYVEAQAASLTGREGEPGALVLFQDVTERVHTDEARDAFLAAAAHDLKTPLAGIKAHAQLMLRRAHREGTGDPRTLDGLRGIEAAANRMTALVNDLLDVTRVRMGRPIELEPAAVDLVALARRSVESHQRTSERHHLRLEAAVSDVWGTWDSARLDRVLDNLLANAIKYSPDGGDVVVRVDREAYGDRAWGVLTVQDQGVGIPASELPSVFERFRRAGNVIGRIEGTGIGLASVRSIVESHGGTVEVSSQEGAGSTFTVRLPIVEPAEMPGLNGEAVR